MKILAIDPSGSFDEGKGTTGWSLFIDDKLISCGQVLAKLFDNKLQYWNAIINLIKKFAPDHLVVEDFILYSNKASSQINSRFETSKLIGIIEYEMFYSGIPMTLQRAVEVKTRWTDDILVNKHIIDRSNNRYYACGVMVSDHIRDSIRHGVHFIKYKKEKLYEGNVLH